MKVKRKMEKSEMYFKKFGAIYVFTLIAVYVASSVYNNLGSNYVNELLRNNLHYALATEEDASGVNIICSIKNTGYSAVKDVKILLWSTKPMFPKIDYDGETLRVVSEEGKDNFIHSIFELKSNIYPGEIKTIKFVLIKLDSGRFSPGIDVKEAFRLKVYLANTPGISTSQITEKTGFSIGPYLVDLLWVIGWTYIDIGIFIVLPYAIFIFLVFYILVRLFNLKINT